MTQGLEWLAELAARSGASCRDGHARTYGGWCGTGGRRAARAWGSVRRDARFCRGCHAGGRVVGASATDCTRRWLGGVATQLLRVAETTQADCHRGWHPQPTGSPGVWCSAARRSASLTERDSQCSSCRSRSTSYRLGLAGMASRSARVAGRGASSAGPHGCTTVRRSDALFCSASAAARLPPPASSRREVRERSGALEPFRRRKDTYRGLHRSAGFREE